MGHGTLLVNVTTGVAQVRAPFGASNLFQIGGAPLVQVISPAEGSVSVETLKDLLQRAKSERGVSGRALAKLAQDHGYLIHNTQVNAILAGTYKSRPSQPLLEAIAWLAGVPIADVYDAADLPLPGPPFADELPPEADQLLPHERRVVIDVIRAFLTSHALEQRADLSWKDRASLSLIMSEVGGTVEEFTPAQTPEQEAARRDSRSVRSRGQQRRDELAQSGEESQE